MADLSIESCRRDGALWLVHALHEPAGGEYLVSLYLSDDDRWEVASFDGVAPEGALLDEEDVRVWWRDRHGAAALEQARAEAREDDVCCPGGCSGCLGVMGTCF